MKISILVFALVNVFSLSAMAGQRISFGRQMRDGVSGTFTGWCYSTKKTGAGKMTWYPSQACWIDSASISMTCKIWAIMPLRMVAQDVALPIWHYSQKPKSHIREQSSRYQIQYFGAIADSNVTYDACVENLFDIDAGDIFQYFGRDSEDVESLLVSERGLDETNIESVLCSSGRIGIETRMVLMYGLTMRQDGKCSFRFSVNGMGDIMERNIYIEGGKLFTSGRQVLGRRPDVDTTSPGSSIFLSDQDTVSVRISYDYKELGESGPQNADVHISRSNLLSILEWLSQPVEKRGSWRANGVCSLRERRIF